MTKRTREDDEPTNWGEVRAAILYAIRVAELHDWGRSIKLREKPRGLRR